MKKIAASVGLIALGTACVTAAEEAYSTAEAGKLWIVSASLRGFYDDNPNNASNGSVNRVGSGGFSVSPSGAFNWQRDSTTISLSYRYSLLYYGLKPLNNVSHFDQDHNFDGALTHIINERYKIKASDSFVVGQEPDTLRSGDVITSTQRIPGDNIRNTGALVFNAELTPLFGLEAGYQNALFDYSAHGAISNNITIGTNSFPNIAPSESGTSDRMEHELHLDGRWQLTPQTTAILGYKFSLADYTGNELIAISLTGTRYTSSSRDSRAHYGYIGAEHVFNPDLFGSAQVGVTYTDYYNDPSQQNGVSPYVHVMASYAYAPESSIQAGFSYDRNATDTIGAISATHGLTVGQQSATIFGSLNHRIIPNLMGSLTAQYQNSAYIGGQFDGKADNIFLLGLNLSYKFAHYLTAELGYNYDTVSSVAGHSYDRNRVYAGISGSY